MTEPLLASLLRCTNHLGLSLALEKDLLTELHLSRTALHTALDALRGAGHITVLSPLPFLVARTRSWSGKDALRVRRSARNVARNAQPHIEVPVSSSAAAAATHEDGGAGEGGALLEQVLAILGPDARRDVFARIVAAHPPPLIRRCLQRVQATKHIRVSKAALFRSLLRHLSH